MASMTPARAYNGVVAQRAAILAELRQGPATGANLQERCNAPDPTARIHELRTEGHPIETHWTNQENPDGTFNRVALYVLPDKRGPQRELDFNECPLNTP